MHVVRSVTLQDQKDKNGATISTDGITATIVLHGFRPSGVKLDLKELDLAVKRIMGYPSGS